MFLYTLFSRLPPDLNNCPLLHQHQLDFKSHLFSIQCAIYYFDKKWQKCSNQLLMICIYSRIQAFFFPMENILTQAQNGMTFSRLVRCRQTPSPINDSRSTVFWWMGCSWIMSWYTKRSGSHWHLLVSVCKSRLCFTSILWCACDKTVRILLTFLYVSESCEKAIPRQESNVRLFSWAMLSQTESRNQPERPDRLY